MITPALGCTHHCSFQMPKNRHCSISSRACGGNISDIPAGADRCGLSTQTKKAATVSDRRLLEFGQKPAQRILPP
jgi:hypothetical protein